jgi:hypothetical protein
MAAAAGLHSQRLRGAVSFPAPHLPRQRQECSQPCGNSWEGWPANARRNGRPHCKTFIRGARLELLVPFPASSGLSVPAPADHTQAPERRCINQHQSAGNHDQEEIAQESKLPGVSSFHNQQGQHCLHGLLAFSMRHLLPLAVRRQTQKTDACN